MQPSPTVPDDGTRNCPQCGRPVAPSAAFCRSCGARYERAPAALPPASPPPARPSVAAPPPAQGARRGRPSGALVFLTAAIVLAAAGVAAAIVLSSDGGSSSTTVITTTGGQPGSASGSGSAPAPARPIEAGRYVQAGSFKFVADAETEQQRLAGDGIAVEVVLSEEAQELYSGFQVLLGGPLGSGSEEAVLLKQLHRDGVPSAFARYLTPASGLPSYTELARTWTGKLEESSTSQPKLDRSLPVTLAMNPGGRRGVLVFLSIECIVNLTAAQSSATASLAFSQDSDCLAPGTWHLRPFEGGLALTLLPPGGDVIVLGKLDPV